MAAIMQQKVMSINLRPGNQDTKGPAAKFENCQKAFAEVSFDSEGPSRLKARIHTWLVCSWRGLESTERFELEAVSVLWGNLLSLGISDSSSLHRAPLGKDRERQG